METLNTAQTLDSYGESPLTTHKWSRPPASSIQAYLRCSLGWRPHTCVAVKETQQRASMVDPKLCSHLHKMKQSESLSSSPQILPNASRGLTNTSCGYFSHSRASERRFCRPCWYDRLLKHNKENSVRKYFQFSCSFPTGKMHSAKSFTARLVQMLASVWACLSVDYY